MPRYGLSHAGRGLFSLSLPCAVLGSLGGQPFVLGLGIGIGLFMVVAYLWSAVVISEIAITASVAGDVTVGEPLQVTVSATGGAGLECAVQVAGGDFLGVRIPAHGTVQAPTLHMGRVDTVPIAVQTGVPDGLVGAIERRIVILDEPVFVYPTPVICNVDPVSAVAGALKDPVGELAGLREYTPGDRIRDVHWPAVARTGTMLVRDNRAERSGGPVAVLVGRASEADLELVAGYTRHAIHILLQRGHSVELILGSKSYTIAEESQAWRDLALLLPDIDPPFAETETPTLLIDASRGATWLPRA